MKKVRVKKVIHSDPRFLCYTDCPVGSQGLTLELDENDGLETEDEASILDAKHKHLLPLVTAYSIDTGRTMTTHSWADLLPPDCTVIKIAEASYAEVYRITIPSGETSIIKVMRIQSPSDPASSTSDTAIRVENIVSEVRIMNTLTELPGFVRFKDAHIILGRSVQAFIDAYEHREELCKADRASLFPHPELYTDASEFLAIELGDAGCVLEDFAVTSIEQVWDILLGTILALAKGEMANEFEVGISQEVYSTLLTIFPASRSPRKQHLRLRLLHRFIRSHRC